MLSHNPQLANPKKLQAANKITLKRTVVAERRAQVAGGGKPKRFSPGVESDKLSARPERRLSTRTIFNNRNLRASKLELQIASTKQLGLHPVGPVGPSKMKCLAEANAFGFERMGLQQLCLADRQPQPVLVFKF